MALADQIFPAGHPRDGHILRLDLVSSWESQLLGVGRATAFMTPRLFSQSHAVDDIGLYVVFLQRHRVELGLKLIQERAGDVNTGHAISTLVTECDAACRAAGFGAEWETFAAAQQEYMQLMDAADPKAATYRYPVDTKMRPWPRETRVDLVELERAGRAFERDVLTLVAALEKIGLCRSRGPRPRQRPETSARWSGRAATSASFMTRPRAVCASSLTRCSAR